VRECYGPKQQNAPSSPATPVSREHNPDQLGRTGQILPLHVFWTCYARIAQERVPTASNVGSRDVTWAPHPTSHPRSRLFACFAGPIP